MWTAKKWRECRYKAELGCDGKHFNKDCQAKKDKDAAAAAAAAAGARGAIGSGSAAADVILRNLVDGSSGEARTVAIGAVGTAGPAADVDAAQRRLEQIMPGIFEPAAWVAEDDAASSASGGSSAYASLTSALAAARAHG